MLNLNELRPKNVVLFFYPRDATPTCTKEAIAFSQAKEDFEKLNTVIIGISKDDIKSHEKFILKNDLKIPLLSDDGAKIWRLSTFGKKNLCTARLTWELNAPSFNRWERHCGKRMAKSKN